jgi:hypothetical protein
MFSGRGAGSESYSRISVRMLRKPSISPRSTVRNLPKLPIGTPLSATSTPVDGDGLGDRLEAFRVAALQDGPRVRHGLRDLGDLEVARLPGQLRRHVAGGEGQAGATGLAIRGAVSLPGAGRATPPVRFGCRDGRWAPLR